MCDYKISVVISVLNGGGSLENCIKSIIEQDYTNIELIVIDGGSIDNTMSRVRKYSSYIHYNISEKDSGVYDAWNKALRVASGSWICFIGSDDAFASKNSLRQLAAIASYPAVNYASGRVALVKSNGEQRRVIGKPFDMQELEWGMKFAHPGSLHHSTLFSDHGSFNESFKIAGDYEFILRCKDSIRASFTSSIIVLMGDCGISHKMQYRTSLEGYKALRGAPGFGVFVALRFFFISTFKSIIRSFCSS
jgi:glycosyltransferase involved in cell wall biosynthesis